MSLILSLAVSIAIGYLLAFAGIPARAVKVAETVSSASIFLLVFRTKSKSMCLGVDIL